MPPETDIVILFQSEEFLAVNKDAGISVHNNEDPQNLILRLERQLSHPKYYPVHRLDKETSGIQILALNAEAARKLSDEFQKRTVKKIYTGIIRGQLTESQGIWRKPLTDKAEGRNHPEGRSGDRVPCETRFQVTATSEYFSLCQFDLITGRQHQIRKHAAVANHPLVGDARYGEIKYNKKIQSLYGTDRMFLHCSRIEILGRVMECSAPEIFQKILTH